MLLARARADCTPFCKAQDGGARPRMAHLGQLVVAQAQLAVPNVVPATAEAVAALEGTTVAEARRNSRITACPARNGNTTVVSLMLAA